MFKLTREDGLMVEFIGEKFVPKSTNVYRQDLNALRDGKSLIKIPYSSGEISSIKIGRTIGTPLKRMRRDN